MPGHAKQLRPGGEKGARSICSRWQCVSRETSLHRDPRRRTPTGRLGGRSEVRDRICEGSAFALLAERCARARSEHLPQLACARCNLDERWLLGAVERVERLGSVPVHLLLGLGGLFGPLDAHSLIGRRGRTCRMPSYSADSPGARGARARVRQNGRVGGATSFRKIGCAQRDVHGQDLSPSSPCAPAVARGECC